MSSPLGRGLEEFSAATGNSQSSLQASADVQVLPGVFLMI